MIAPAATVDDPASTDLETLASDIANGADHGETRGFATKVITRHPVVSVMLSATLGITLGYLVKRRG